MGKRLSKLESQRKENEEATYASIGAAFVKLLRDESAPKRKRETALRLAHWLHLNMFTAQEAWFFVDNTGLIFDPALDQLYPKADDEPSALDDDVRF